MWVVAVAVLYAVSRSVGVGVVSAGSSRNFPGVLVFRNGCKLNPFSVVILSTSVWERDQSRDSLYRTLWDSCAILCCVGLGPGVILFTCALEKWLSLVRAFSHKSLGIFMLSSLTCFLSAAFLILCVKERMYGLSCTESSALGMLCIRSHDSLELSPE